MSVTIVAGGQYGSEGKGHLALALARSRQYVHTIRVGGPNSGHCVVYGGTLWKLRQIPAAVFVGGVKPHIAAGSVVDVPLLVEEVDRLEAAGVGVRHRLTVHPEAVVLSDRDKDSEASLRGTIGSTGSGTGSARASHVMRSAALVRQRAALFEAAGIRLGATPEPADGPILVEGCQGYGLGIHAGHYPFCTSVDCDAVSLYAMSGLPAGVHLDIWTCYRTYPIRVGGNSGYMFDETDWESLGHSSGGHIQPEVTTVTKKVRRVAMWDTPLARASARRNGGTAAVMFADYRDPALAGVTEPTADVLAIAKEYAAAIGLPVGYVGTGPDTGVFIGAET